MLSRIMWVIWRRFFVISNFKAHFTSNVDKNTSFDGYNRLGPRTNIFNSALGRHTYVVSGSIANTDLGSFVSIGPNCLIGGLGRHPVNWISTSPVFYSSIKQTLGTFVDHNYFDEHKRTSIGNNVWVGANVTILDGVTVHDGAVIAAGSVVTHNVASYTIVGGVPARRIRKRFNEEICTVLSDLPWWKLTDKELSDIAPQFRKEIISFEDLSDLKKLLENR